jgi:hypothetical protein
MRGSTLTRMAVVLAAAAAMGCSPQGVALPSHHLVGGPTAILASRLINTSGCLKAQTDDGHQWMIVWPRGTSLVTDAVFYGGRPYALIGGEVTLGGGEYKDADYEFLRTLLDQELPAHCRSSDYWLAVDLL